MGYLYMLGDFVGLCKVDPLTGTHTVLNSSDHNNQWPDLRSMALLDDCVYVPSASGLWRIDLMDGSFEHINDRDWSCVRTVVADPADQSLYMLGDFLGLCKMHAQSGSYIVLGNGDTNHWWGELSVMCLTGRHIYVPYSTGMWKMDITDGKYTRVNTDDWSAARSIVPAALSDEAEDSSFAPSNRHVRANSMLPTQLYFLGDFDGVKCIDISTGDAVRVHPPPGDSAATGGLGVMRWPRLRAQGVAQMKGGSSSSNSMPGEIISSIRGLRGRADSDVGSIAESIAGSHVRAEEYDVGTNPLVQLGANRVRCEVDVALDEKGGLGIILSEVEEQAQQMSRSSSWRTKASSWRRRIGRRSRTEADRGRTVLQIDSAPDALRGAVVVCRSQHTKGGLMHRPAEASGLLRAGDVLVKLDGVDVCGLDASALSELMQRRVEHHGTEGTVRIVVERKKVQAQEEVPLGLGCCDANGMGTVDGVHPLVKLTSNSMEFINAFARFSDGDLVDGWTERKNEKLGATGQVVKVHANQTMAIRFQDGQEMNFPLDITQPVESIRSNQATITPSYIPSKLTPLSERGGSYAGQQPSDSELQRNCDGLAGIFTRFVFGPDCQEQDGTESTQSTPSKSIDEDQARQPDQSPRSALGTEISNVTHEALATFFEQHGVAEKVVLVDEILAGYKGKHDILRQDLHAKYGAEPRFDL
jgi:hypothetical protein